MKRPNLIQENVLLAPHTTYRIGGPARYYARPNSRETLQQVLSWAREQDCPLFVLGAGSNVLVADRGYSGLVLHLRGFQSQPPKPITESLWEVGSGTLLTHWVRRTVSRGYAGAEALIGIPGTLGGALRMNAGAFSVEISQILESVEAIRWEDEKLADNFEPVRITPETIGFAYRSAPGLSETIILSARFRLTAGDPQKLLKHVREIIALRRSRQPLDWPSCGSVFKRPADDFAGRLIEASGLKGKQHGRAQVSPQHANFIINLGGATAGDILGLIKQIKAKVLEDSGAALEREVVLIGFEDDELAGA